MSNFTQYDLGHQAAGSTAVVTLQGNAANVRLLDSVNFDRYRQGARHNYYGGHATSSPVRLTIPNAGHWYVVVDLQGQGPSARVQSSARVEAALPRFV